MMLPKDIIQTIANDCNLKTKLNIQATCKYLYDNIIIYTFYDNLQCGRCYRPNEYIQIPDHALKRHKYIHELNIYEDDDKLDNNIKHLRHLKVLFSNKNITGCALKNMNLHTLWICPSEYIFYNDIKHMNINTLYSNINIMRDNVEIDYPYHYPYYYYHYKFINFGLDFFKRKINVVFKSKEEILSANIIEK